MEDDILTQIDSMKTFLTPVEQIIADYFLMKKPPMTIKKLSKILAVSPASVSRFIKKIGLNNYKEFNYLYSKSLSSGKNKNESLSNVANAYLKIIENVGQHYNHETIDKICELIHETDIVYIFGIGFNIYSANDIAFRYAKVGKYINVIDDINMLRVRVNFSRTDSVYIILTLRGDDRLLEETVSALYDNQNNIVVITSNEASVLINFSNYSLITSSLKTEHTIGDISPQLPMIIQLDLIYNRYMELYGDTIDRWRNSEDILR